MFFSVRVLAGANSVKLHYLFVCTVVLMFCGKSATMAEEQSGIGSLASDALGTTTDTPRKASKKTSSPASRERVRRSAATSKAERATRMREPGKGDVMIGRVDERSRSDGAQSNKLANDLMMGIASGVVQGLANGAGGAQAAPSRSRGSAASQGQRGGPCVVEYMSMNPRTCAERRYQ
jgi:hypothetical protein